MKAVFGICSCKKILQFAQRFGSPASDPGKASNLKKLTKSIIIPLPPVGVFSEMETNTGCHSV